MHQNTLVRKVLQLEAAVTMTERMTESPNVDWRTDKDFGEVQESLY